MTCGGITVEVDAASGFEDTVQLYHALRHHREIRHHVVLAEEGAQGSEQLTDFTSLFSDDFLIGKFGFPGPSARCRRRR